MKKQPRYYQTEAAKALVKSMLTGYQKPYAQICTGGGKSLILAMLSNYALKQGARVLQIVPTMELASQNYKEAIGYIDAPEKAGIVCSKLNRFQYGKDLVIATPGSIINKLRTGLFDFVFVDECHLLSVKPEGQYYKILDKIGSPYYCGVSATPYRFGQGELHNDCADGKALFTHKVYETDIKRLIAEGYLSHVESISGDVEIDTTDLKMKGRDYDTDLMCVKFDKIMEPAVKDIKLKFEHYGINSALLFCSNLENARKVVELWGNDDIAMAHGEMNTGDRNRLVNWIKTHPGKRYIVNVGLYTTGFDYPALDCVVFLRATTSLNLYMQICGRVIRAADGKFKGYVLDYGTNIDRFGSIDETLPPVTRKQRKEAPIKVCLLCNTVNLLNAKKCKDCEAQFISNNEDGLYSMRSRAEILKAKEVQTYDIDEVVYSSDMSSNGNPMITIHFISNNKNIHKEFLNLEHPGNAKNIARAKFRELFKDTNDYYALIKAGREINVDNAYYLLENQKSFFKKIKSINLRKQEDSKYKKLAGIEYV
jgi:DNA repair protein RadD